MNINQQYIRGLHVVALLAVALLIGGFIGYTLPKADGPSSATDKSHSQHEGSSMSDTMTSMTTYLSDKNGPDFDKAFAEEMMIHHEGAVAMAQLALSKATKTEVKQLAEAIIQAQTIEIKMMRDWLTSWSN